MVFFAAICFVVCHGGPAEHFAEFAKRLKSENIPVQIYATGPALAKFEGVDAIPLENFSLEAAEALAAKCSRFSVVMTDVGHEFDLLLQEALTKYKVTRLAYYDNPEPYVPGGYSATATKVMRAAEKVLFANANLAEDPTLAIPIANRIGIGYYPVQRAKEILARREKERHQKRAQLHIKPDQKVLAYFGGNNDAYFNYAFPAFLSFLQKEDNFVILMQQHPGAKKENRDLAQIGEDENIILSPWNSEDALLVADAALYYQTSMGPLFALAGIPAIQVGHEPNEDLLVRGNLCSLAATRAAFLQAVEKAAPKVLSREDELAIYKALGIREDWFPRLKGVMN